MSCSCEDKLRDSAIQQVEAAEKNAAADSGGFLAGICPKCLIFWCTVALGTIFILFGGSGKRK